MSFIWIIWVVLVKLVKLLIIFKAETRSFEASSNWVDLFSVVWNLNDRNQSRVRTRMQVMNVSCLDLMIVGLDSDGAQSRTRTSWCRVKYWAGRDPPCPELFSGQCFVPPRTVQNGPPIAASIRTSRGNGSITSCRFLNFKVLDFRSSERSQRSSQTKITSRSSSCFLHVPSAGAEPRFCGSISCVFIND